MKERRVRRSNIPVEAVRLQLRSLEDRFHLEGLVLADQRGIIVASSEANLALSEVLAAFAPIADHDDDELYAALANQVPGTEGKEFARTTFQLDGEALYLCGLTESDADSTDGFEAAIGGVRRIIGESS
jgi:hypothetical protein